MGWAGAGEREAAHGSPDGSSQTSESGREASIDWANPRIHPPSPPSPRKRRDVRRPHPAETSSQANTSCSTAGHNERAGFAAVARQHFATEDEGGQNALGLPSTQGSSSVRWPKESCRLRRGTDKYGRLWSDPDSKAIAKGNNAPPHGLRSLPSRCYRFRHPPLAPMLASLLGGSARSRHSGMREGISDRILHAEQENLQDGGQPQIPKRQRNEIAHLLAVFAVFAVFAILSHLGNVDEDGGPDRPRMGRRAFDIRREMTEPTRRQRCCRGEDLGRRPRRSCRSKMTSWRKVNDDEAGRLTQRTRSSCRLSSGNIRPGSPQMYPRHPWIFGSDRSGQSRYVAEERLRTEEMAVRRRGRAMGERACSDHQQTPGWSISAEQSLKTGDATLVFASPSTDMDACQNPGGRTVRASSPTISSSRHSSGSERLAELSPKYEEHEGQTQGVLGAFRGLDRLVEGEEWLACAGGAARHGLIRRNAGKERDFSGQGVGSGDSVFASSPSRGSG
ncbi:hypothetical protein C8F01DRAFT_1231162 [Mycena amicta]|nr:hypothetical protein C8F01DRAFT_1231162 [Mycena amicta]